MTRTEYRLEYGSYYLYEVVDGRDRLMSMTDQVAIGFSNDPVFGYVLHRHGNPESVQSWLSATRAKLKLVGNREMADSLGMAILASGFPTSELNLVIANCNYLEEFLTKASGS